MNSSESSKSSLSGITESGSRTRSQAQSTDSTDNPSSSSTAPATVDHSTLAPLTIMNANNTFFPGQLSHSPHMVNPSAMPGNNSFGDFPTTQPLPPQYQQQLMMWPFIPQQSFAPNVSLAGGPSAFVNSQPPVHFHSSGTAGPSRLTLHHISPVSSQIHSPTSSAQESPIDPEEAAVVEDKRRRNTAASGSCFPRRVSLHRDLTKMSFFPLPYLARFRIKKKQKNLNLERTVSDLTSRAEELEREATNLRRENSWLKEIVMMKGRQNLAGNSRPANEDSRDAGGDNHDDDAAEGSEIEHGHGKKLGEIKIKGKSKANSIGNGRSKGRGK